jgi:hypothetical protein
MEIAPAILIALVKRLGGGVTLSAREIMDIGRDAQIVMMEVQDPPGFILEVFDPGDPTQVVIVHQEAIDEVKRLFHEGS